MLHALARNDGAWLSGFSMAVLLWSSLLKLKAPFRHQTTVAEQTVRHRLQHHRLGRI